MPLSQINNTVPSAVSFQETSPGKYLSSSTTFNGPQDYYQISPVRTIKGSKEGRKTFSVLRHSEADVTVSSVSKRVSARINIQVELDPDYPVAGVDAIMRQLDEFISVSMVGDILKGRY